MTKRLLVVLGFVLISLVASAQRGQTIKGRIIDKESHTAVIGALIVVTDVTPQMGGASDADGNFKIDTVPVGKRTIVVSGAGYNSVTMGDVLVTSAKEVVLNVELEETVTKLKEVTVSQKREHINDMAIVSTKTFNVQETERYAGSRADPARMASNFAGVQGGDDSRNDIIIRGNSPQGVLWRLEGIDIPNPNHFSIPGTSGGPVSMLNSKTLANSDFFTGAFPSEYGNAVAGAFDVKLRNGNSDKTEFTGQFGFLGTELAAEGPISGKKHSSFLVTYRYSTLQLFQSFNIKIGTTSIPHYQDATFKLNFPMGKKGTLTVFGIGGLSNIELKVSDQKDQSAQLYGESDRDQYFTSNTGVLGMSATNVINSTTYTKFTVAVTGNNIFANHDFIFRNSATFAVDSLKPILGYDYKTTSWVAHWFVNKKFSSKSTLRIGAIDNTYWLNLVDSSRQYPVTTQQWQYRQDYKGSTELIQVYAQYKYRPNEKLSLSGGLHGQYLTHSRSFAVEPRLGMRWAASENDIFTAGYGLHSQMQPLYQYFTHFPNLPATEMHNYNVGFTRSHHLVAGYDRALSNKMHLKLEAYYQYLFKVPIEIRAGSSYSALDQGTGYSRYFPDTLQNTGTGYNYGFEATLEKGFSHGFYFLLTGSLFDSKAKGNDGVYRNTDYNCLYAANALFGYEHKLGKYSTFLAGIKMTTLGGKRYSPVDTARSLAYGDAIVVDSLRNTLKFKDYFRTDIKIGARFNSKKVTHELGLDLVNVLGIKNELSKTYSQGLAIQTNGAAPFFTQYQLGFLPIFYYRIDFGIKKKGVTE